MPLPRLCSHQHLSDSEYQLELLQIALRSALVLSHKALDPFTKLKSLNGYAHQTITYIRNYEDIMTKEFASLSDIKLIDLDTATQLAISRNDSLLRLSNLRIAREQNQDDIDYLKGTLQENINLEAYSRAIETVLKFNKYKELL